MCYFSENTVVTELECTTATATTKTKITSARASTTRNIFFCNKNEEKREKKGKQKMI